MEGRQTRNVAQNSQFESQPRMSYRNEAVITTDGSLVETNMDDIEFSIAQKYYLSNEKYMEA